jgi:hypothetical protein
MRLLVGGHDVPRERAVCRPMNFGQPVAGVPSRTYLLEADWIEVDGLLRKEYAELVEMLKSDEKEEAPFKDAECEMLRVKSYPDIDVLLKVEPSLLEKLVEKWFDMEVLDHLLSAVEGDQRKLYILNSVTSASIDAGKLKLTGEVFEPAEERTKTP